MSAPEDLEALLAEHVYNAVYGDCNGSDCNWQASGDEYFAAQHRAHVAAELAAYVVEKQREAVEAAAAAYDVDQMLCRQLETPMHALDVAAVQDVGVAWLHTHAATTYPTPKETP